MSTYDSEHHFTSGDDPLLHLRAEFRTVKLTGNAQGADLRGAHFWNSTLANLDLRGAHLEDADFADAALEYVDLRGAILHRARLDHADGLETARCDDDTLLDGIAMDKIAARHPLVARRLRQHHYAGSLKRTHPIRYWIWQCACGCGRSWVRLMLWGLSLAALFAAAYYLGLCAPKSTWLPHMRFVQVTTTPCERMQVAIQFSAMTFAGFNMAGADWTDGVTGFWTAAEACLGLAFIGILVTVVAVTISART